MGGDRRENTDWLSNLLALDPEIHNSGPASVHGHRGRSEEMGWLIEKHFDEPIQRPVRLHSGVWVALRHELADDVDDQHPGYIYVP